MAHINHNNCFCIIYKKSDSEKIFAEFGLRTRAGDSNQIIEMRPSQPQRTPELSPACP